jgi:hypothetical protein
VQATYENFGCNEGDVFVMGIDKGNSTQSVLDFDATYGITFPDVSGSQGGGNQVHLLYEVQSTPCIVIIAPDREILEQQVYPPSTTNITAALVSAGAQQQSCTTSIVDNDIEEEIKIFPNPVVDLATINFQLEQTRKIEIKVYNLTGQLLINIDPEIYNVGLHLKSINFSEQPNGLYFVQFLENNKILKTRKIVKHKK